MFRIFLVAVFLLFSAESAWALKVVEKKSEKTYKMKIYASQATHQAMQLKMFIEAWGKDKAASMFNKLYPKTKYKVVKHQARKIASADACRRTAAVVANLALVVDSKNCVAETK